MFYSLTNSDLSSFNLKLSVKINEYHQTQDSIGLMEHSWLIALLGLKDRFRCCRQSNELLEEESFEISDILKCIIYYRSCGQQDNDNVMIVTFFYVAFCQEQSPRHFLVSTRNKCNQLMSVIK